MRIAKNNLDLNNEPSSDSDDGLLILERRQNLQQRVQNLGNDYNSSRPRVSSIPAAESSKIEQSRQTIDSSGINKLRENNQQEYILHTRLIQPKDDKEKMRNFVSQQCLEDTKATWTGHGDLDLTIIFPGSCMSFFITMEIRT